MAVAKDFCGATSAGDETSYLGTHETKDCACRRRGLRFFSNVVEDCKDRHWFIGSTPSSSDLCSLPPGRT